MAVKKKNKPKSSNTDVYYICYKDEIVPTADQRSFIRFNFGAKRWLKNRMLEDDLFMYNGMLTVMVILQSFHGFIVSRKRNLQNFSMCCQV